MKTVQSKLTILAASLTLATALLSFETPIQAAEQIKGGERIMQMQAMKSLKTAEDVNAVQGGDVIAMACPKCKSISYMTVDRTAKGANKEVKTITRDACPACGTKIVTTGVGKQAKNEIQHTCKTCGSHDAFCAVMKMEVK